MEKKKFFEITYNKTESTFCYRSGLCVFEEKFINGMLVSSGYNTAGYPLNVLTNYSTAIDPKLFYEPSPFNLEVNGVSAHYDLSFVDFSVENTEREAHSVLTLESNVLPLRLKIHTVLNGSAAYTRYIDIENLSDATVNVSRMAVMAGALDHTKFPTVTKRVDREDFYSIGYFGSDAWGMEGDFAWHSLPLGKTVVDCRFDRDRFRHPLVFVRNNLMGKTYFAQMGWSGGCRFTVDHNTGAYQWGTDLKNAIVSFKAEMTGYAPIVAIKAGETVTTPELYMGAVVGDLDEAVNEMHSHIRRSVLVGDEIDPTVCLVGAGMGAEHPMTADNVKAFIDQMGDMGAEVFILDAGWVCPVTKVIDWSGYNGVNIPHPDRYPNGITELVDYSHARGMKFGLWVEIERLGRLSGMIEKHPDWMAHDIYGNKAEGFIDMTNPEAAEWARSELERMIVEYKLDLLRVDYNVSARYYFNMRDTGTGVKECLSYRHFKAVYDMYGSLKKQFPNVIFENCASGGGRTDLGIMKCFHHTWVSDWQRAPRSVMITNGITMALPPERVDRLFAGMNCHEYGAIDLHMRNIMLGHMSVNVVAPDTHVPNPIQMEFIQHSIEIYKNFIRPMLPTSKIYHHTPEAASVADGSVSILEIAAPDGSQGAMTVCTLTGASADMTVRLKGIDAAKTYEVTLDNSRSTFKVSGYELSTLGVRVAIPSALSSELILYRAI